jgi:hypothetical protein
MRNYSRAWGLAGRDHPAEGFCADLVPNDNGDLFHHDGFLRGLRLHSNARKRSQQLLGSYLTLTPSGATSVTDGRWSGTQRNEMPWYAKLGTGFSPRLSAADCIIAILLALPTGLAWHLGN